MIGPIAQKLVERVAKLEPEHAPYPVSVMDLILRRMPAIRELVVSHFYRIKTHFMFLLIHIFKLTLLEYKMGPRSGAT